MILQPHLLNMKHTTVKVRNTIFKWSLLLHKTLQHAFFHLTKLWMFFQANTYRSKWLLNAYSIQ